MVGGYKPPELSAGVDSALKRLGFMCARDGYDLRAANIRVVDTLTDREVNIVYMDGEWREFQEVD